MSISITEVETTLLQVIQLLLNYLQENQELGTKVVNYQRADVLKKKLDLSLSEKGVSLEDLIPVIQTYLEYSTRTSSANFFNLLLAGFEPAGLLSEMVTSVTNTTMHTYEAAPVATLIEMAAIDALNSLVGFNQGEGLMVTGGSNANTIAMLVARHKFLPDAKYTGLGGSRLVAFISDQAHYSFLKAANQLGIGMKNVVKVETDRYGCMIPEKLEDQIVQSVNDGKTPFFVGATAGTTVLGGFDPLPSIAEIVRKYGLWLHVDAAWGCPVLFSSKHKHLLEGSGSADSFTWDAHKLMGVPLICSAILVKQKGMLSDACSSGDTDYLFHDYENADYDLGQMSLQCGRKVDALKLWLSWKHRGKNGYEQRVERLFELASYATEFVRNCEHLELLSQPQFLNICFRYTPDSPDQTSTAIDRINLAIRDQLLRSGQTLINYAHLQGRIAIRLILANPEIQSADLNRLFHNIITAGKACERNDE